MKKVDLYKKFKVSKRALELLNSHDIGLNKRISWEKAGWMATMKCNFLCDPVKSEVRFSSLIASSGRFIFNYVSYFDAKENKRVFILASWASRYDYLNYNLVKFFVEDYLSTKKYIEEVVNTQYSEKSFSLIESSVDSDQSSLLNFGNNWDGDTVNKENN